MLSAAAVGRYWASFNYCPNVTDTAKELPLGPSDTDKARLQVPYQGCYSSRRETRGNGRGLEMQLMFVFGTPHTRFAIS